MQDRIGEVVGLIRENMKPARIVRLHGQLGSYVHHDGSVGVLSRSRAPTADPQVLRDVCMHIAATNPLAARREDVPADVVEKEKEIAQAQIANDPKNAGKPANILDKIAEGKLKTLLRRERAGRSAVRQGRLEDGRPAAASRPG